MAKPDIFVPSSINDYVYIRTQGTTRCTDCLELAGGVGRLTGDRQVVCLTCHVDHAVTAVERGWVQLKKEDDAR